MTATSKSRKAPASRSSRALTLSAEYWKIARASGIHVLQAKPFTQAAWLVHGFSTRPGGASRLESGHDGSQSVEKVLNLGLTDWDSRERVAGNRRKFLSALGASRMRLVTLRQAHSDMIHVISRAPENSPRGDAAITAVEGLLLSVQTADCVPILLADMHCRVVAAVHSGWRGTLKRIAAKTVGRMQLEFGTNPRDIVAALGPAIGRCSYEVGSEIAKEFASQFAEARDWFDGPFDRLASDDDPNPLPWLSMAPPGHQPPSPRLKLDLFAANRAILLESGVNPENIFACGLCTACRTDLFFSYRREHHTGRMMAVIGLP